MTKKVHQISDDFQEYYKTAHTLPEKRLLIAMLERAIHDYCFFDEFPNTCTAIKETWEDHAKRWLFSKVDEETEKYFLSFSHICQVFGFDRKDILFSLKQIKKEMKEGNFKHFNDYQKARETKKKLDIKEQ